MSNNSSKYRALIIGATGGIGTALCREIAGDADLFLAARGEERLAELSNELGANYKTFEATDSESVAELFTEAKEALSGIDAVVHLVGSVLLKAVHITKDEEWLTTMNLNLNSAFYVTRESAKAMRKNGGSIVLMSSAAACLGLKNHEAIAAAKGGINGLVKSAAATYSSSGIRVNAVAPGLVETPLTKKLTENEASRKVSEQMHPLGRIGTPEDVARMIAFLINPQQSWLTGQIIGVDGGLATLRHS